jgi:hypothetical protein
MQIMHWRLSRLIAGLVLVLLVLPQGLDAAWSTLREVEGADRNLVEIDGHRRAYWKIDAEKTLEIDVSGPAKVRVYSRAPYRMSQKGKSYGFSYSVDGEEPTLVRHRVSKSRSARLIKGKKKRLSASRTDEIVIPPGKHQLRIKLEDGVADELFFRLRKKFVHPMPKGGNIDKYPVSATQTRDVIVGENRSLYHILESGGELDVEVIGPTFLKVISRIDWNSTMSGQQKYMLKFFEDGEFMTTWALRGRHSDEAVYGSKLDSTPARGEVIYVEVPKGKHRYTVRFQDSGREVNLRFLIPRESLRNGE